MKAVSILVNLGLSLFTLFVLLTDGMPTEARFIALSLLVLLVPGLTALVINQVHPTPSRSDVFLTRAAAVCNLGLLGAACWALVTQFPSHPKEAGLVPYVALTLAAPALSLFVLRRHLAHPPGEHAATH
jgi:predicted MFS family arabinose efflux permease